MTLSAALQRFGHTSFRGDQETICRRLLQGGHCLVLMPTGMGKSICYQVPALISNGLTLVISPLIALMKDQVDSLRAQGIEAAFINSQLSREQRQQRYRATALGRYKLLYVTPERFQKQEFIDCLAKQKVTLLAIDEAHCISQWGHDFRPDYTRIKEFRKLLNFPTTIALTATAPPDIQQDIIVQLGINEKQITTFKAGMGRPNLHLSVEETWDKPAKTDKILHMTGNTQGNGIVYFSLIKTLEECSRQLFAQGVKHLCYHGNLPKEKRKQVQDLFMQGQNNLILATNAFGMGIDKDNIRYVVHAEIPGSMEAYYQEIGRAGRDGKHSDCLLLYDEQDLLIQMDFIKWNNPDAELYCRLYAAIKDDSDSVNAFGLDGLKESLIKNKGDFRLETALALLARFQVTRGSLEQKSIMINSPLPDNLASQEWLHKKTLNEQKKLHAIMQYAKHLSCRTAYIHQHFGLSPVESCSACDRCSPA